MSRWWYGYERSTPRQAKGGIKARSNRGAFAESWWAGRWIAVLESFHIGARLDRGRSYARRGQVLSIDFEKGGVVAKVQGSRELPYRVKIAVTPIGPDDWRKVAEALSREALFTAKLLAGEMPQEIEDVFREVGLSLFPERRTDLQTDCSCPDWSNPCKHIAAVYYLLGEEFDRDPFLLFRLRGITREEFVALLAPAADSSPAPEAAPPPEPLPADPAAFWGAAEDAPPERSEVHTPSVHAALAKRLGGFPFWRGDEELLATLEPICACAAQAGIELLSRAAKADGST